jgi:hypothetical protein
MKESFGTCHPVKISSNKQIDPIIRNPIKRRPLYLLNGILKLSLELGIEMTIILFYRNNSNLFNFGTSPIKQSTAQTFGSLKV